MHYILSKALTRCTYTNSEQSNETAVSAENATPFSYFFIKPNFNKADRLRGQAVSSTSSGLVVCVFMMHDDTKISGSSMSNSCKYSNPPLLHQLAVYCVVPHVNQVGLLGLSTSPDTTGYRTAQPRTTQRLSLLRSGWGSCYFHATPGPWCASS